MKREVYKQLLDWKDSHSRKPLMVYGARQVGKTYIIREFGEREFENLIYINCYKNKDIKNIFSSTIDVVEIIRAISGLTGQEINPGKTLLFFDEAQEIPDVVASMKYFCEDARDYHVVVAGSLLGVLNMENISFPTGKVNMMQMYPMTYIEFMMAMGEDKKVRILQDGNFKLIDTIGESFMSLLRQYYFVGGMPEAVKEYSDHRDINEVRKIQVEILNSYYADIAKHAGRNTQRCHLVFQSIPMFLARENKKFIFNAIKKGGRASEFETAIQWLVDAGLVYQIHRISKAEIPLSFYVDNNAFKLYLLDVGLMGALADVPPSLLMEGNNILKEYKGAFTENYVCSQLVTKISRRNIAYYNKNNSQVEIDFILQYGDKLIPVEVKAEGNVRSKSFHQFVMIDNKDKDLKGLRLSMKGYVDQGWMINIPLYGIDTVLENWR